MYNLSQIRDFEKAGGKAIVIPGMASDMKLGDVMHENNSDIVKVYY